MRSGFLCYSADPAHKARETDPPPAGQLIPVSAAFQSLRASLKPQSHYVWTTYIFLSTVENRVSMTAPFGNYSH